ncbi:MAG: formylglycine-generating enzyme family protein [Gemmatimonadota bacterium]|nr:formylglycine-generating enzyme family protein [Gemmatimonadota bacterium]MDH3422262.1 formylglycine-generating enzyme family protein [Gemmatimonadota bacterium]
MPPPQATDPLNRGVFIQAGLFTAGSDDRREQILEAGNPYSKADELRLRRTVESFWIQEHEVTNAEYRRFDPQHTFASGLERHPVVEVTWVEARAYAAFVGGRLPTDAEWEFAARGAERRTYPWGEVQPTCDHAHFVDCGPRQTLEVMSREVDQSPEGVYDLAGNVREWTVPVWFDAARHPANHDAVRAKGGSFEHPAFFLRGASVTKDWQPESSWTNVGFRVSWPANRPD